MLENIFGKTYGKVGKALLHLHIALALLHIVTFALPFLFFFHVAGYWECGNTNTHIDIHWFADTILQSTILDKRLGILMQILIAMAYCILYIAYLYISDIYLQFNEKNIS